MVWYGIIKITINGCMWVYKGSVKLKKAEEIKTTINGVMSGYINDR